MLKKLFEPTPAETDTSVPDLPVEEPTSSETKDMAVSPTIEEIDDPVDSPTEEIDLLAAVEPEEVADSPSATDITAVRELILALHPTIVPELIGGDSIDALIASIEPAQAAYKRIVSSVSIPAGGNAPVTLDVESLPTFDKIRRGLAQGSSRK